MDPIEGLGHTAPRMQIVGIEPREFPGSRGRAWASTVLFVLVPFSACGGRSGLNEASDSSAAKAGGPTSGGSPRGGAGSAAGGSSGGKGGVRDPGPGFGGNGAVGGNGISGAGAGVGGHAAAGPEPLWRRSYEPFCAGDRLPPEVTYDPIDGGPAVDIWSEPTGVYAIVQGDIYFNPGTGWTSFAESVGWGRLTGFIGGPLVKYGFHPTCSINVITSGSSACIGAIPSVRDVFVVDAGLSYAINENNVFRYDGMTWVRISQLQPANTFATAVWANRELATIATLNGRVYLLRAGDSEAELQVGLPNRQFTSVWGERDGGIWVGDHLGELHRFNGSEWSSWGAIGEEGCGAVRGMWGAEDAVYFYTGYSILVRSGTSVRTIATFPCDGSTEILALHGNSAGEVFVMLRNRVPESACGEIELRWFDGSTLRPL